MNLAKKKGGSYREDQLVLAMDFEGTTYQDLASPSRAFGFTRASDMVLSTGQKINGTQSFFQLQAESSPSGGMYTSLTPELTFPGDFWFETWAYMRGQGSYTFTGGNNVLLAYGSFTSAGGLHFWGTSDLYPVLNITDGGTSSKRWVTGNVRLTNEAWYHHAIGRKDGRIYLFVNGKLVGTAAELYTNPFGFGPYLNIGNYWDGRNGGPGYSGINGYMDRLRMYNKCLTTSDFTPLTTPY
jgi:hypothetical protein